MQTSHIINDVILYRSPSLEDTRLWPGFCGSCSCYQPKEAIRCWLKLLWILGSWYMMIHQYNNIYIYYHYILYLILVIMICQFNVVQFVFLAGEEGFVPVSIWVHEKTTIASGPALHQVARRHWPRQAWQARRRVHALSGWNSHGLYTVNLCAMWVGSKKWGPENPPIFGHVLHGLIMFDLLKKYAFYINFSTYNSSSYRSCVVFAFRLQQRRQYSLRT